MFLVLLAGVVLVRRRSSDPEGLRSRSALRRLRQRLREIEKDAAVAPAQFSIGIMEIFREYLGDKLGRTGATSTRGDVERLLEARRVPAESIGEITILLESCEAGAYAGEISSAEDRGSIIGRIRSAAENLEKRI
jgi:hypothetical protein